MAAAAGAWAAALGGGAAGRLVKGGAVAVAAAASSRGKKKGGGFARATRAASSMPAAPAPGGGGFAGGPPTRATLEIPAADTSPAGTASLALSLAASLAAALGPRQRAGLTLCFGDVDAALAASDAAPASLTITALGGGGGGGGGDGGGEGGEAAACLGPHGSAVLVVCPSAAQADALAALLGRPAGAGRDVALLNPLWSEGGGGPGGPPPPAIQAAGFKPAYAFIPVAVSTFLGLPGDAGAVVYTPGGPWRIYKERGGGGGEWALVGRSDARPGSRDLEDAFYNASAASSPLTKGAAALKGLADRVTGRAKQQ